MFDNSDIGRQFLSLLTSPFFGISLIQALLKFVVSVPVEKQWWA
jgi:hypothetical protein